MLPCAMLASPSWARQTAQQEMGYCQHTFLFLKDKLECDNMAKKDKVYMPSGTGGLIRYQDAAGQKIKLKPEHVVYTVVTLVVLEIVLKIFFG